MKTCLAALAFLTSGPVLAITLGGSTAVTGAANPVTTSVPAFILANSVFEVVGVIPVVSTVTGAPASMAASVYVGASNFSFCANPGPGCSNDMWAAQWTIISAPSGIQAVNAYQGTSVRLVNSTASSRTVDLRCQVGQMTGSCIFVFREQPIADPLF